MSDEERQAHLETIDQSLEEAFVTMRDLEIVERALLGEINSVGIKSMEDLRNIALAAEIEYPSWYWPILDIALALATIATICYPIVGLVVAALLIGTQIPRALHYWRVSRKGIFRETKRYQRELRKGIWQLRYIKLKLTLKMI